MRTIRKDISNSEFSKRERAVLAAWKNDGSSALELGRTLNQLRKAFYQHGKFTKWITEHKIDRNRASYCMRLDNGKHKAGKRPPTQERLVVSSIKKDVDDFLKYCSKQGQTPVLEVVQDRMAWLFSSMCSKLGELPNWKIKEPWDLEAKEAAEAFKTAVSQYLDVLFTGTTLEELENNHHDAAPASQWSPSKTAQPIEQPATSAHELVAFKTRAGKLMRDKLEKEGGLKNASVLLREYILKQGGVRSLGALPKAKWEEVLSTLEKASPAEAAKMLKRGVSVQEGAAGSTAASVGA